MSKMGRPAKYQKKYCDMLVKHMKKGLSFESFGPSIGVSTSTTYRWLTDEITDDEQTKANKKDFREARNLGFDYCRLFWEQTGIAGVWTSDGEPKLNTTAWIFNMKNRFGWSDRKDDEGAQRIQTVRIELPNAKTEQVISMDEPKKIGPGDGST